MQEIFEKIIEELEELKNHYNECCLVDYNEGAAVGLTEAMNIVRQAAAEDNNGWIPCSKRLPAGKGAYVDADFECYPSWVECTKCHATGQDFDKDDKDEEKAIEAWNRRENQHE